MAIVLFDTERRSGLYPLAATQAVAASRMGICTIQLRWHLLLQETVYIETVDYLQGLYPAVPPGVHIFIDAQVMPNAELVQSILHLQQGDVLEDDLGVIACKAFATHWHSALKNGASRYINIVETRRWLYAHQLLAWNAEYIRQDFALVTAGKISQALSTTNQVHNSKNVFVEEGAQVEFAIINANDGPVYIGKNCIVMEGCLVRGPMALCEGAVLKMGAKIYGATTLGPYCTGGGEIKNSVLQGYSNKGHDGYLGDSLLGRWCNLGAGSSNSNLKNTAGEIRLWNEQTNVMLEAGNKCGVLMGDYSRVAINSSINTGSMYGVCCNVFGAGLLPRTLSSFSWGTTGDRYDLEKATQHIDEWKKMKGEVLTGAEKAVLQHIFDTF